MDFEDLFRRYWPLRVVALWFSYQWWSAQRVKAMRSNLTTGESLGAFSWIFLALAIVLGLGAASDARSEVYRWTDSQGVVHFSDQPVSTDPQVVKEVSVPKPNMVDSFKARSSAPAQDETQPEAPAQDAAPGQPGTPGAAPGQKPKTGQGSAAESKQSCLEKVAAYKASRACFRGCAQRLRGGGWNTAGCEHCVDQPMPPCWSRY